VVAAILFDKPTRFFANTAHMKTNTLSLFLIRLLTCFALLRAAQAIDPPPDGGYPGANTAAGDNALLNLTDGVDNTAVGFNALRRDTIGSQNTATGSRALTNNIGIQNTATGSEALFSNIGGSDNTAIGFQALFYNLSSQNTATGAEALLFNIHGGNNTANGFQALLSNRNGYENTATGLYALRNNINGNHNTANGAFAMVNNTTGNANTGDGYNALFYNTTGSRNIAVGVGSGSNLTTGDNNIDIGNQGVAGESGHIRIGTVGTQTATFIPGIRGATVENGIPVVVGLQGQLGTMPSSVRFKEAVKPMDEASEAILALKPVTFRYKNQKDTTPQFGLVAEDVAEINSDLIVRDEKGEIYTVRYDAVNAMLLNEFLKAHHQLQDVIGIVAEQQKQIERLTAGVQRVNAQLQVSKPPTQTVLNNQ
jgi:Chaperone of endosialidase